MQRGFEHVGHQHGVVHRVHADAALKQHQVVALQIVADLEHALVFQQRTKALQHLGFGKLSDAILVV